MCNFPMDMSRDLYNCYDNQFQQQSFHFLFLRRVDQVVVDDACQSENNNNNNNTKDDVERKEECQGYYTQYNTHTHTPLTTHHETQKEIERSRANKHTNKQKVGITSSVNTSLAFMEDAIVPPTIKTRLPCGIIDLLFLLLWSSSL